MVQELASTGELVVISGSTTATRYLWTAREHDAATGLQHNRNRDYDSNVGRFLNEDPISFGGGDANLYRYVGNGPTNATDPFGLFEDDGFDDNGMPGPDSGPLPAETDPSVTDPSVDADDSNGNGVADIQDDLRLGGPGAQKKAPPPPPKKRKPPVVVPGGGDPGGTAS